VAKSTKKKRSREARVPLAVFARCRVCWLATLTVFLSILAVGAVLVYPSYLQRQNQLYDELRREAGVAMSAAISGVTGIAPGGIEALSERLIAASLIVGVSVYTAEDTFVVAVGEHPQSTLDGLKRRDAQEARVEDGFRYEIYMPPLRPANPYQWILKIDSESVVFEMREFLQQIGLLVLFVSAVVCGVVMVVTAIMVFKPLLRIRYRLRLAMADPEHADRYVQNSDVANEIGDVDNTLDELLYQVSHTYQEDLAVSMRMVRRWVIGVVAYDPDGQIAFCNERALQTFACDDAAELAAADFPKVALSRDGAALAQDEFLRPGREVQWGYLQTPHGTRACVFGAGHIKREDGGVSRRFLTFLELDDYQAKIVRLDADSEGLRGEAAQLRQTLNQCLNLLQILQKPAPDANAFRPAALQQVAANWIGRQSGPRRSALRHDVLPFVQGEPGEVDMLVGSAVDAVLAASGDPSGAVFIRAEESADGTVRIDLAYQDGNGQGGMASRSSGLDTERTLAMAILARLLARQGGRLVDSRLQPADARLVFTLPAGEGG